MLSLYLPILLYARAMKIFKATVLSGHVQVFNAFCACFIATVVLPLLYDISAREMCFSSKSFITMDMSKNARY